MPERVATLDAVHSSERPTSGPTAVVGLRELLTGEAARPRPAGPLRRSARWLVPLLVGAALGVATVVVLDDGNVPAPTTPAGASVGTAGATSGEG